MLLSPPPPWLGSNAASLCLSTGADIKEPLQKCPRGTRRRPGRSRRSGPRATRSPEAPQRAPQHRPGLARVAADEDLRVSRRLLVLDVVEIHDPARRVAGLEQGFR